MLQSSSGLGIPFPSAFPQVQNHFGNDGSFPHCLGFLLFRDGFGPGAGFGGDRDFKAAGGFEREPLFAAPIGFRIHIDSRLGDEDRVVFFDRVGQLLERFAKEAAQGGVPDVCRKAGADGGKGLAEDPGHRLIQGGAFAGAANADDQTKASVDPFLEKEPVVDR